MNNVVFIGAGFSISAGVPRQNKIIPQIVDIDADDLIISAPSIVTDLNIVREILLPYIYGKDYVRRTDAILPEDIYSILDNAILNQKNFGFLDHTTLVRFRSALDNCVKLVTNANFSDSDIESTAEKIAKLMKSKDNYTFISTNWDTLLESALRKLGLNIDFGIPEYNGDEEAVLVLKPHGSFDWKWCPVCDRFYGDAQTIYKCASCDEVFQNDYNSENILKKLLSVEPIANRLLPIFITPTFFKKKSVPFLDIIFQKMLDVLSKADHITFIGYSLPISDHDIREILLKAKTMGNTKSVKVILKENKKNTKAHHRSNYRSVYDENILKFKWLGF